MMSCFMTYFATGECIYKQEMFYFKFLEYFKSKLLKKLIQYIEKFANKSKCYIFAL